MTVSVVSGEVTLTSMYHVCVSCVAMASMMPCFECAVVFHPIKGGYVLCRISGLFDPFAEGVFDVVVSFGAVWSGLACHAVVGVCVEWFVALRTVAVVLACFVVGVCGHAQS